MKRPLLLRVLPDRVRMSLFARFYRRNSGRFAGLYRAADLAYAPGVHMELMPGDVISDCIAFTGVYELDLTRRVMTLARLGGTFIDVGANLGYFSLLLAAARPANRCIAFEASPRNIDYLSRNIRRNGFDAQVEVVPHAAGKLPGKFQFDPGPEDQSGWGGLDVAGVGDGIEVDVVRIDEVISAGSPIALLKVDIEGADAWALMGADALLRARSVQEVWFEQNKPRSRTLGIPINAAQDYLRSVGYAPMPVGDTTGECVEWSAVPG